MSRTQLERRGVERPEHFATRSRDPFHEGNCISHDRRVDCRTRPAPQISLAFLFNRSFFEDGFCTLQGSFIPFAPTKAERLAAGDTRLSLEERYPSKEAYVTAMKTAAESLVRRRYLLPEDAARLVAQAERDGIRTAP